MMEEKERKRETKKERNKERIKETKKQSKNQRKKERRRTTRTFSRTNFATLKNASGSLGALSTQGVKIFSKKCLDVGMDL